MVEAKGTTKQNPRTRKGTSTITNKPYYEEKTTLLLSLAKKMGKKRGEGKGVPVQLRKEGIIYIRQLNIQAV